MDAYLLLKAILPPHLDISAKEMATLRMLYKPLPVPKKKIFLEIGEPASRLFFVAKGLIRTFHFNENGQEFTRLIAPEGKFCTILSSFSTREPSPASIQALEDSLLLEICYEDFKRMVEEVECAREFYTLQLENFQKFQISRLEMLTQLTPQERILKFHREEEALARRLTHKIIASYLQMTPETYSRICRSFA